MRLIILGMRFVNIDLIIALTGSLLTPLRNFSTTYLPLTLILQPGRVKTLASNFLPCLVVKILARYSVQFIVEYENLMQDPSNKSILLSIEKLWLRKISI